MACASVRKFYIYYPAVVSNTAAQEVDAFGGEVLCTYLLVTTVFAATDGELGKKHGHIHALLPFAIGMAVLLCEYWGVRGGYP